MSDDRDELIRARAYAIWQAEGCPDGRSDQHWRQAALDVDQAAREAKVEEPASAPASAPVDTGGSDAAAATPASAQPAKRGRVKAPAAATAAVSPKPAARRKTKG